MERFVRFDAAALPLPLPNIDTDQIIPARFLRKPRNEGLGRFLFHDLRFDDVGRERPGFALNRDPYRAARILVAERNFGCGSSREYAVYALWDYGFRAVIAPSFGDIFYNNCLKNGLLPIILPPAQVSELLLALDSSPGAPLTIDLAAQQIIGPGRKTCTFEIDPFRKRCLLEGLDELGLTLEYRDAITTFEARQTSTAPWLTGHTAR